MIILIILLLLCVIITFFLSKLHHLHCYGVCVCMHGLLYEVNDAYSEVAIIMYTEFTSDLPLTDR